MTTQNQPPEESAQAQSANNWRARPAVELAFPRPVKAFVTGLVVAAGILVVVVRPMMETPYAPGVTVRLIAALIVLLLSAWLMMWVVIRGGRWYLISAAVLVAVVAVPCFGWAATTWLSPLGGPVGSPDHPAYLGERFEVVIAEGPTQSRYSVVTGTALQVTEVAREDPPRPANSDGFDYYADARCWAVQIELTTRYDERLAHTTEDSLVLPLFRPAVTLTAADGTVATGELWEDDGCETGGNTASSSEYRTPSSGAGITTYMMWITVQLPTNQLPTAVEVDTNGSGPVSYYVPELPPGACGTFEFCGGLLTLYAQSRVWAHAAGAADYYWEKAVKCSAPNDPEYWCG